MIRKFKNLQQTAANSEAPVVGRGGEAMNRDCGVAAGLENLLKEVEAAK